MARRFLMIRISKEMPLQPKLHVLLITRVLQKSSNKIQSAEQPVRRAEFGETDASFMFGRDFNARLSFKRRVSGKYTHNV